MKENNSPFENLKDEHKMLLSRDRIQKNKWFKPLCNKNYYTKIMTQEDKELRLKDLCARLPYNVICSTVFGNSIVLYIDIYEGSIYITNNEWVYDFKPYLRPMSSMTEEESNELESITFPLMKKDWDGNENSACIRWIDIPKYMDFILSHHFDYQGLIEKGLAIPVTEENNPYKRIKI